MQGAGTDEAAPMGHLLLSGPAASFWTPQDSVSLPWGMSLCAFTCIYAIESYPGSQPSLNEIQWEAPPYQLK